MSPRSRSTRQDETIAILSSRTITSSANAFSNPKPFLVQWVGSHPGLDLSNQVSAFSSEPRR